MDLSKIAPTHVRVVTARADRRINGARGSSHALCYSEHLTSYDVSYKDARRLRAQSEAQLATWVTCEACRDLVVTSRELRG